MNYRDTLYKFEGFKPLHQTKTPSIDSVNQFDIQFSPRSSDLPRSKFFQSIEGFKERNLITSQKSQDIIKNPKQPVNPRSLSGYRNKETSKKMSIQELEVENKELKEKIEILQQERDLLKSWKKPRASQESKIYQDKLNFLVKHIQQFLNSSLKFQTMLREKLGQTAASMYEEERNALKKNMKSAAMDFEIPFLKYSPNTSPLRGNRSPKPEEFSSWDSESTKIMEELKVERNKTKRLQTELNNELCKKDDEMKNIRDRILELEMIEKNKIENDKKFAKLAQEWVREKKEMGKEIEKYQLESKNAKEKSSEFDAVYEKIQEENVNLVQKNEEITKENFKLSESLQVYDRLYNYTKKWAEKAVGEMKHSFESEIREIYMLIEQKNEEISNISSKMGEININPSLRQEYEDRLQNMAKENDRKINEIEEITRDFNFLLQEKRNLEDRAEDLESDLTKINEECLGYESRLQDEISENSRLNLKIIQLSKDLKNIDDELQVNKEAYLLQNEEINKLNSELIQTNQKLNRFEEIQKENYDLKEEMQKLKDIISTKDKILKEHTNCSSEIAYLNGAIDSRVYELQELEKEYTEILEIHEKIVKEKDQLRKENDDFEFRYKLLDSQLNTLNESMEKLSKENMKYFMDIAEKNKKITENRKRLEEKGREFEDISMINSNLQQKLNDLNSLLEEKENLIESQEKHISELNESKVELIKRNKEFAILENRLNEKTKDCKSREDTINIFHQENENLKIAIENLIQKNKELSEIYNLNEIKPDFKAKLSDLEIELQSKISEIIMLNSRLLVKEKEINDLKSLEKSLASLEDMVKIKDRAIENLESSLRDRDVLVYNLNQKELQISKLEQKSKEYSEKTKEKDNKIEVLSKKISDLENLINNLEFTHINLDEYRKLEQENLKLHTALTQSERNQMIAEKLLKEKTDLLSTNDLIIKDLEKLKLSNTEANTLIKSQKDEIILLTQKSSNIDNLLLELSSKDREIEELKDLGLVNYELAEEIKHKDKEIEEINLIHDEELSILASKISSLEPLANQLPQKNAKISELTLRLSKILDQSSTSSNDKAEEISNLTNTIYKLTSENKSIKQEILELKITMEKSVSENNIAIQKLELQKSSLTEELNTFKQLKNNLEEKLAKIDLTYHCTIDNLNTELEEAKERIGVLLSEYDEAKIADKEEISRLNSQLLKHIHASEMSKKEILSLTQGLSAAEALVKLKSQCDNCKTLESTIQGQKEKLSSLECLVHSAEEALGGFFCNTLAESISSLVSSKTQGIRRAPRPPLLRGKSYDQKKKSEEIKIEVIEELINKSPIVSERSNKSQSSALSLPDFVDLRNELSEEKCESERYLTQIKILKEDIRDLERKLKRSQEVNTAINTEVLTSTLIKMVRNLPVQTSEVEGMISLIFTIISVPKDEIVKLEPERRAKKVKRFGVF